MKKIFFIVLSVCMALVFLQPKHSSPEAVRNNPDVDQSKKPRMAALRERQTAAMENSREAGIAKAAERLARGPSILETTSDFAKGVLQNLTIEDGLRLAHGAPAFGSAGYFGTYTSRETEAPASFDTLTIGYQVSLHESSRVQVEVRARAENGDWLDWRPLSENEINAPLPLSTICVSWQYRFTLAADQITASPRIYNATMSTSSSRVTAAL